MKPVVVVIMAVFAVLVFVGTSVDPSITGVETRENPLPISFKKSNPVQVPYEPPELERIILPRFGGDRTAPVEALIGDKILDFFVIQRLLTRFKDTNVNTLTKLRSTMVSNERLAAIGKPLVVPHFMSPTHWKRSSVHDKGTAVECIIGRTYLSTDTTLHPIPQFSPVLVRFMNDVLIAIQQNMQKTRLTNHTLEPFFSVTNSKMVCVGEQDPVDALNEWLMKRNLDPESTLSVYRVLSKSTEVAGKMRFVAKFNLIQPQMEIQSPPQKSEKSAKTYVCKMALQHLGIDTSMRLTSKEFQFSDNIALSKDPGNNMKNKRVKQPAMNSMVSNDHHISESSLKKSEVEKSCESSTIMTNQADESLTSQAHNLSSSLSEFNLFDTFSSWFNLFDTFSS